MCGIAGQVRTDGAPVPPGLIEAMGRAQEHRGPDCRGTHRAGAVGLGIQRLRVIDLDGGDQPIYNEDGSVVVILNGEIYNYRELRERLHRSGHRFATAGDTEVIVHLYEELGPACVHELIGMFAFALWDEPRRQLLLARDRLGKKPLFYAQRAHALSFASELPALMADPEISTAVDAGAIDQYLAHGYVPAPQCAYAAVRKLRPGHLLIHRPESVTVQRYWRLDFSRRAEVGSPPRPVSDEEAARELRERIGVAVRRRMIADVPTGAFLSGGIDSAVVVASMAEHSAQPVRTFSIGFEDRQFDERAGARLIAQRFATEHHEIVVAPDAVAMLPRLVRHYGEPFADHSAVACFYLAEFARRHVTVALNGDGGDEGFGGYHRYSINLALARLDRVPGELRRAVARWAGRLPHSASARSRAATARYLAVHAGLDRRTRYLSEMSMFTAADRDRLYSPEFAAEASAASAASAEGTSEQAWNDAGATTLLRRMMETDVNSYLPGDLLAKMDIATMAHSLEGRSPLLDHELLEYAAALPDRLKVDARGRKRVLRMAARGWIPDQTLDAPKRGFELPVTRWIRTELRDYARDVLLDSGARGRDWARPGAIEALLHEHQTGARDHGRELWTLLMLELWWSAPPASGHRAPAVAADQRPPR
jgi:asparagine synthase (glutamine-hydrolysing)